MKLLENSDYQDAIMNNKGNEVFMTRKDSVLNMQITIANCMKREWNLDFSKISDLLDKYDLLSYIDTCYEEYNSMGIKGIMQDLKSYIDEIEETVRDERFISRNNV